MLVKSVGRKIHGGSSPLAGKLGSTNYSMSSLAEKMDEVQAKLLEIQILQKKFEKEISLKRKEILALSLNFTSYWELYKFSKAMSKDQEEFNLAMLGMRDTFFRK